MRTNGRMKSFVRPVLLLAVAGLTSVLVGCGSSRSSSYDGLELAKPVALPDVTLTDTSGQSFNLPADSKGKLALYYFGYTNCPDVCPTTMADLGTALTKLSADQRARV